MALRILTYYEPGVPHISLVFGEMWGATVGRPFTTWTDTSRSAVESHISRKTSEIPRISCTQHRTRPLVRLSLRKGA